MTNSKRDKPKQDIPIPHPNLGVYKAIFEESPIAIEVYDNQGLLLEANPACLEMFGVSNITDVMGFNLFEDPNLPEELKVELHQGKTIKQITAFDFEKVRELNLYKTSRLDIMYLDEMISPLAYEHKNRIEGYLVQIVDVTDRILAEDALRRSERRYRAVAEDQTDLIIRYFPDGTITFVNEAYSRQFNRLRQEIIGQNYDTVFGKNFFSELKEEIGKISVDNLVISHDNTYIRPDGKLAWFSWKEWGIFDSLGNVIEYQGVGRDITERKQVEDELHESERRYREMLENFQLAAIIVDTQESITFCNDYLLNLLGYQREELIGKNWDDLCIPIESREEVRSIFLEALAEDNIPRNYENEIITRQGERRLIAWNNSLLRDSQGNIIGSASIGEDITLKRQVEEEIKKSENRFRSLFNYMAEGVALHRMVYDELGLPVNYEILDVNSQFEEILNIKKDAIVNKLATEVYSVAEAPYLSEYAKVVQTGKTYRFETYFVPLDKHFIISVAPLEKGFATIFFDVTEQKRVEATLHASEEKFRLLVESAPDAIFVHIDERFAYVNTAAVRLFGAMSPAELLDQSIWERYHPDYHAVVRKRIQQVAETGLMVPPLEQLYLKLDGSPVSVDVSAVPFTYQDKKGELVFSRDITDRKRAEAIIKEKTQELDNFFSVALDLLCIADTDGYFQRLNHQWERTLGYNIKDLEGKRFLDFVHLDDLESTMAAVSELTDQKEVLNLVNRYHCKDGSYRWLEWRSYPVGKLIYAAARDITDRIRKEEELARSNKELEQFAFIASHDLQEPLRKISNLVNLFQRRYTHKIDEIGDRYITSIIDNAIRMQNLITDLLEYSRVGTGEMPLEAVNLESLFTQVLVDMEINIGESGASITHDPLPVVWANSIRMHQVFQNLISNAIKFQSTATLHVHVSVEQTRKEWLFSVRDNGIGIEPKYADKIFVIFQRLHNRDKYTGSGIGLAICKRVIERHGGRIWVESKPDQGSTFYFTLPTRA